MMMLTQFICIQPHPEEDAPAVGCNKQDCSCARLEGWGRRSSSRAEIGGGDGGARERVGCSSERDAALLQTTNAMRRLERLHEVLFDNDQRASFGKDRR